MKMAEYRQEPIVYFGAFSAIARRVVKMRQNRHKAKKVRFFLLLTFKSRDYRPVQKGHQFLYRSKEIP